MKIKLIILSLLILVISISIGSVTYAFFTDSIANTNNTFSAGTVSIKVYRDMGDSNPGPMVPMYYVENVDGWKFPTGYWAPGDNVQRVLIVKNTGSLASQLKSVQATLSSGSSRYLADELQVVISTDLYGNNVVASGTLGSFIDEPKNFANPINVGYMTRLYFCVTLPQEADNSYQSETLTTNFNVLAEQKVNNP